MLAYCEDCGDDYDPIEQWDHCPHRRVIVDHTKISPPLHMAPFDWRKVGTGLLMAILGAILTVLEEKIPGIDFGPTWTPFIVALNSALVNLARKFLFISKANVA